MNIVFLKNHLQHKKGDVVKDHPNAAYLVRLKVAEVQKEAKKKKGD